MADSGTVVAQLGLELGMNEASLKSQLTRILSNSQNQTKKCTETMSKQMTDTFSGAAKKIGAALGAAFGIKKLASFTKSCLDLGSDLAEVQNVVDTSFASMSDSVDKFAKDAMKNLGMSETITKKYMGTIGAMNNAFGFTEKQSYDMAKAVTELTGDVASFYNLDSDTAFTKLKSIWTGETESLKELGVVMTQTALDEYALNNGFGKTTAKMTEQEKVMLRYQFVMSSLSNAQGDFVKTQDGWANQTRILTLQLESLKATLGQGFINLFNPILKGMNNLLAKLSVVAEKFKDFTELIAGKSDTTSGLGSVATDALAAANSVNGLSSNAGDAADSVNGIAKSAKEAARSLAGFDKITKLSDNSDTDSSNSASSGTGDVSGSKITSEVEIKATSDTSGVEKAFEKIKKAIEPLKNISFDNLKQSFDNLKKSVEPLTDKLFDGLKWMYDEILVPLAKWTIEDALPAFLDVLSGALDVLNSVLDALKPLWIWAWDNLFKPIAEWTGGIAVKMLDKLAKALTKLSNWISKHKKAVQNMTIILTSFFAAFKLVKFADKLTSFPFAAMSKILKMGESIKAAFAAITSPAGLAVIAIGLVIAAIVLFIKNWESIKEVALYVWEAIKDAWGNAWEWFKEKIVEPIKELFKALWDKIKELAEKAWKNIKDIWSAVTGFFKGIGENIHDIFKEACEKVKNFFTNAWNGIKNIWNTVTGFFSSVWTGIKNTFSSVGTWFSTIFTNAWNGIKNVWNTVGSFFGNVWTGIKNTFSSVSSWFRDTFSEAWQKVKDVFSTGGKVFAGIVDGIAENFKSVVNTIIKGINKVIALPFGKINEMLNDIRDVNVLGVSPFKSLWSKNPLPVPEIPQLAQGGYVSANAPQLAIIGDNRHQGEIVSPENKLKEMAVDAINASRSAGDEVLIEILRVLKMILVVLENLDLDIVIDGKKLKDIIVNEINKNTKRNGVCEILL